MEHHIQCKTEDIARYVILPRDPEKAEIISARLDDHRFISDSRGYYVFTGHTDDVRVTVASTGVGGPQLAIGAEELAHMGSDTFIRLGACFSLQEGLHTGDLVIPIGAYRGGTTGNHYLPPPFPAVPDFNLLRALGTAAVKLGKQIHWGINVSVDAIFAPRDDQFWSKCREAHALSLDMETDTLFVISSDNGWRSGAILVVGSGISEARPMDEDAFTKGENSAIQIAFEAIKSIAREIDQAPAGENLSQ